MAFVLQSKYARRLEEKSEDLSQRSQDGKLDKQKPHKRCMIFHTADYDRPQDTIGWRSSDLVSRSGEEPRQGKLQTNKTIQCDFLESPGNCTFVEEKDVHEDPFATNLFQGLPHPNDLFGKKRNILKRKLQKRQITSFDSHLQQIHRKQAKLEAISNIWGHSGISAQGSDSKETSMLPSQQTEVPSGSHTLGQDLKQQFEE